MELLSKQFTKAIRELFSSSAEAESNIRILATVPINKGRPLPVVDELRNRPECRVFTVG
jgi:hypothetical protein